MEITNIQTEEFDALLSLWEASIRATHKFLSDEDISFLKPLVRNEALPNLVLRGVRNSNGTLLGFLGVSDNEVETLFVTPNSFGQGIGKALMEYAESEFCTTKVSVNEQNPEALGFYQHLGYKIVGRSELDGQGLPFPILHLEKTFNQ